MFFFYINKFQPYIYRYCLFCTFTDIYPFELTLLPLNLAVKSRTEIVIIQVMMSLDVPNTNACINRSIVYG